MASFCHFLPFYYVLYFITLLDLGHKRLIAELTILTRKGTLSESAAL